MKLNVIKSNTEPNNKNVLWLSREGLKEFKGNGWEVISTGEGNNIAENAGGGGGTKILFLTDDIIQDYGSEFSEPFLNHNAKIYNAIIEKYMALMQCNSDNANEILSNMVNIFNDSFFKLYDAYDNYEPGEYFNALSVDGFFSYIGNDSESNELILVIYVECTSTDFGLYPNGELKIYGEIPV